jgi:Domain of unknown function DUF29
MSNLYDDDILLWSEQQAAAIRRLGRASRVPNDLDIENVAEEIESVGRSELAAVESYIELIFLHLIKLTVESEGPSARHWRGEIAAFHSKARRRYSPSMRQRIDVNALWGTAREQAMLTFEGVQQERIAVIPIESPFALDDLLAERIDIFALATRLR